MRFFIAIVIFIALEIYAFQLIRTLSRGHWWKWVYLAISLGVILNLMLQFYINGRSGNSITRDFSTTLFIAFLSLKAIFILFMFGEDIYRFFEGLWSSLSRKRNP
ncbi:MAG: hypothetical protein NWQ09_09625 [Nonlabens sp.]|nr:hypothetical protein [Nonlabens sp.]